MTVALFAGNELIVLDGVEVDAKLGEFHSFGATPTQFAIESGAITSDHIIEQPDTLEVSFVLSNLDDDSASYGIKAAVALETLRARMKERRLYEVITRHRIYSSMAITSVKAEHVSPFAGALRGRVAFVEVNTTALQRVRVNVPRKPSAAKNVDKGRVESKEPTDADKKNTKGSLLSQLFSKGKTAVKSRVGL